MTSSNFLGLSSLVLLCFGVSAYAQDCSPLRPTKPINTEVVDKTKANANVLLKSLGSGEIENEYKSILTDVLSKYPNADRVHVWDSFIYMLCTLLESTKSLTDKEKIEYYQALVEKWRTERPGADGHTTGKTQSGSVSIGNIQQESHESLSPPIAGNTGQVTIQGAPSPSH